MIFADIHVHTFAESVEVGQWVLLKQSKGCEEEGVLWLGLTTVRKNGTVTMEWGLETDQGSGMWVAGNAKPKQGKTTIHNLLAVITGKTLTLPEHTIKELHQLYKV